MFTYNGYANTNELQAQITHTWGNGLTLQSYFTWGKFLTTTEAGLLNTLGMRLPWYRRTHSRLFIGGASYVWCNNRGPVARHLRKRSYVATKTFQLNAHYQFPFGKGQRYLGNAHGFLNALVSGYNISPYFLWHSGFYFSPYFTPFSGGTVGQNGRGIMLAPGKTGILPQNKELRNTGLITSRRGIRPLERRMPDKPMS